MKRLFFLLILLPLATLAQNRQADEQAIRLQEKRWFDAAVTGNADLFEEVVDRDFYTINHDGSYLTNRAAQLAMLREAGPVPITIRYQIEGNRFRFPAPNVAFVNGQSSFYWGPLLLGRVQHTEGWIKRDGQWLAYQWQGTPDGLPGNWLPLAGVAVATLLASWLVRVAWRRVRKKKVIAAPVQAV